MFSGRFDHAIDNKGRVSIPARFREVLQKAGLDRLYITNFIVDNERCLQLYLPSDWERLVGRIKEKASFNRNAQLFQIFYIGGAHEVEVDRQGRILIPTKLREFAHLDKEVDVFGDDRSLSGLVQGDPRSGTRRSGEEFLGLQLP